jgi:tRNA 5-methylaminomethyl-2-thiouridine biosynthesis bifunctional protein
MVDPTLQALHSATGLVPIQTGDGSYTFYNTTQNIYFRSLLGARSEAEYVFLEGTQIIHRRPNWQILELGFGPGMNFLTTARAFLKHAPGGTLSYHVVEQAPLSAEILTHLKYEQWIQERDLLSLMAHILQPTTPAVRQVSTGAITLTLYPCSWEQVVLEPTLKFDAIYHDPFGPAENPDSWTPQCFAWEAQYLAEHGRLATYGAATAVRKAMVRAGLHIASRKGSGNKREMTLAAKEPAALQGLRLLSREKYQA